MSARYDRDDDLDGFPKWVGTVSVRKDASELNRWVCDAYLSRGAVLKTVAPRRALAVCRARKACAAMDGQVYMFGARGVEEL